MIACSINCANRAAATEGLMVKVKKEAHTSDEMNTSPSCVSRRITSWQ